MSSSDEFKEIEAAKDQMIEQATEYMNVVDTLLEASQSRIDAAVAVIDHENKLNVSLNELKVTWLERCAAMLRINAVRYLTKDEDGKDRIQLVFADTDYDPIMEDDGTPSVVFNQFEDIAALVIRVPKKEEKPN
tara:strand:- start:2608 stop:3009 length:402 start_codon:yes stop_codon:yes gene_type:complete